MENIKQTMSVFLCGVTIFALTATGRSKQDPPHFKNKINYLRVDTNLLATKQDVVCRMNVKNKLVDTIMYNKKIYGFCGTGCKKAFMKSPVTYLKK